MGKFRAEIKVHIEEKGREMSRQVTVHRGIHSALTEQ